MYLSLVQRQLYDYLTIIITESHETVKLNRLNASLFTNGRVNIIYVCDTCGYIGSRTTI